jgi:ligand-binding SRPBCC domain-containing protein
MYILKREQLIARPVDEVFAFFERPENLARITPPSMALEILTPAPIKMAPGTIIDYTVRAFGIRHRWTTIITAYDPPHRFVDVQLRGPYSFWHHTHTFEAVSGGTMIRDEVRYLLPMGILGQLAHHLAIKRQLSDIFDYRSRIIAGFLAEKLEDSENVQEETT